MQEFYINQNSVNPVLRMEIVNNGEYDYKKNMLYNCNIQNADVTFSMKNTTNGLMKISKSKVDIITSSNDGCEEKFILQYKWKKRDVNEKGTYKGWFEINFKGDFYKENIDNLTGNFILPVENELIINIL